MMVLNQLLDGLEIVVCGVLDGFSHCWLHWESFESLAESNKNESSASVEVPSWVNYMLTSDWLLLFQDYPTNMPMILPKTLLIDCGLIEIDTK